MRAFLDCRNDRKTALALAVVRDDPQGRGYAFSMLCEEPEHLFAVPLGVGHLIHGLLGQEPDRPACLPEVFEAIGEGADLRAVPLHFAAWLITEHAMPLATPYPKTRHWLRLAARVNAWRLRGGHWTAECTALRHRPRKPFTPATCGEDESLAWSGWCVVFHAQLVGTAALMVLQAAGLRHGSDGALRRKMTDKLIALLKSAPVAIDRQPAGNGAYTPKLV